MATKKRAELKDTFSNGKRPSGEDFSNVFDSFVNLEEEGIGRDANDNLVLQNGLTLGDTSAGAAGTLRYTANAVQIFDGTNWQGVGSDSNAPSFKQVGATSHIAFNGGNVGIGTGSSTPPAVKLDVALAAGETVKVGNGVLSNGPAGAAQFSQASNVANDKFALRQESTGEVRLNAPMAAQLMIAQGGNTPRLTVMPNTGVVIVNGATDNGNGARLQVQGNLFVNGDAFKTGNTNWQASDVTLKKDIRPLTEGLQSVLQLKPVRFRYNGKTKAQADRERVGVIAQEVAAVLPNLVSTTRIVLEGEQEPTDVMMIDSDGLMYVLINAVQELAGKVQELQSRLTPTT